MKDDGTYCEATSGRQLVSGVTAAASQRLSVIGQFQILQGRGGQKTELQKGVCVRGMKV